MKKLSVVLLCFLCFGVYNASAQKNIVRFSPLSLVKFKAKLHYERSLTENLSAGVIGSYFFGAYPGFRVSPFARFYFNPKTEMSGPYAQARYHYSMNSLTVETTDGAGNVLSSDTHKFDEMGGSINLGWQFLMGPQENFALDLFAGYRFSSIPRQGAGIEEDGGATEYAYKLLHSNFVDLGISLGYKF